MFNNAIFCDTKSKVPQCDHWVILEFSSIYIPGDERSRTHPGHGYPAHSENVVQYRAYLNRQDWVAEIQERMESRHDSRSWQALEVKVPTISTRVEVD